MSSLKNKVILITGASSGIGAASARLLARKGAKLILVARRKARLLSLKKELSLFTAVYPLILDIRKGKAVLSALTKLPLPWKSIDILINNAGLAKGIDPIAEGNIKDWDDVIDTNIKGVLYMSRAVLPDMLTRKQGHIINIGSISGRSVYSGGAVYCATKFALRAITDTLKLECHGTPIRITEIAPGSTETEFSLVRYRGDEQRAKRVYEGTIPLKAEDIADAILYATTRPQHVDIREIVLTAVDQSSVRTIHRRES